MNTRDILAGDISGKGSNKFRRDKRNEEIKKGNKDTGSLPNIYGQLVNPADCPVRACKNGKLCFSCNFNGL